MKIQRKISETISPEMIGLFFEDINFAADGGLYAEMIENRSFESKDCMGYPGTFCAVDDCGYGWSPVQAQAEKAPIMQYVTGAPLSAVNPHYLRFTATAPGQGFANKAYDGIYMKKGMTYHVSFYARCVTYDGERFQVCIEKEGKKYASACVKAVKPMPYLPFCNTTIEYVTSNPEGDRKLKEMNQSLTKDGCLISDWVAYECELTSEEEVRGASFQILLDGVGAVEFDLISMMPDDAVAGVFRADIFQALKEMKPGFIRFPGGCIVEGISLDNGYQWKETVGPIKDRRYKMNLWSFDDDRNKTDLETRRPDSHYGQSFGIGFYEYFLLCELLGAKPLPILNIGVACQYRTTQVVTMDSKEFQNYVQDALDLIEFANGSVDSKWGALRASMGHPESFHMDMLGVGNEQWETHQVDLMERSKIFEEAIHAQYPQMKLIGTAGPHVEYSTADQAWEFYRKEAKGKENFYYAVDEHYYVKPQWMYDHVALYDSYPRDVAVFAGEYAAHTKDRENNMEAALAEASLLTVLEKNAGVVKLASYAPLFNRIGHSQWKPDMIWFDEKEVFPTPNYYVQKMYGNHMGDHTLVMDEETIALRKQGIYISVSETKDKECILKVVNTNPTEYILPLLDEEEKEICTEARTWTLTEGSKDEESKVTIAGSITVPAESFMVIRY